MWDQPAAGKKATTMKKLGSSLRFLIVEFGPLIVFWALTLTLGVKTGIAGTLLVIAVDSGFRVVRRRPFTRLYLVVSTLTLGFGSVDLLAATPFLLVYEAPITNLLTGAAFVVGAFGEKPMLMELAEQRPGANFPHTEEVRRFFRLFTLIWAAYFFLKALFYLWIAATLPLTQALALRSVLGSISLGVMIALSVTQGRRLFFLCRRAGWLGAKPAVATRSP
jgi:intracellular septation protein A